MNSLTDIWSHLMETLAAQITSTSYSAWFHDASPVAITDNRLYFKTSSEFKRNLIQQRFLDVLKDSLFDLFSSEFEVIVMTPDEDLSDMEGFTIQTEDYTFENFIVGPSNKFAHAAAVAVSEKPGKVYNPLFIYGNSGLGKTHLLLAICEKMQRLRPGIKVAYLKSDDFTNEMVSAITRGTNEEFRKKYRNVDLFLLDDIQFISGKEGTQEEFFHTFNSVYEAGNQIVVTSDRPPRDMLKLEDRLKTRFEGGLLADIQPPDFETRCAIIKSKSLALSMVLPENCIIYIAENLTSNVRQLEGVVKRLTAYRDILDDQISIETVKKAIKDVIHVGEFIPTPDIIIEESARSFQLSPAEVCGQSRAKNITLCRQIAMYLIRKLTGLPLKDIGLHFEDRNHTTVLSSIRKIEELLTTDPEIASTIKDISANINSRS